MVSYLRCPILVCDRASRSTQLHHEIQKQISIWKESSSTISCEKVIFDLEQGFKVKSSEEDDFMLQA
jgi:hypothetical protein